MAKSTKKTKVSIIVLTINSKQMLLDMLENVSRLKTVNLNATCIVVDNGSTDGTKEAVANYKRSLPLRGKLPNMKYKYIKNRTNLGFAGGNNVGIKDCLKEKSDYIILMNNDLILPEDIATKLVDFMDKNPDVGAASPKMYFAKGYEFHKDRYKKNEKGNVIWYAGGIIDWNNIYSAHRGVDEVDCGQYEKTEETDFINGACTIIKREVFEKVGLLDASFFLYWEDADFSMRVKSNGYKIVYFPKTHIWHKVSVSAGGSGSFSNDYFLTRNRLTFAMRYAKLKTKLAVIKDTIKLIFFGRTWQKWGAVDALLGRKEQGQWKYS